MSTNNNKKRKASDDQQVVVDDDGDRDRGGRGAASATSIEDLVATMIEYTRKADIRANKAEIRQEKAEKRATQVEFLLEKLVKNTNAIINNTNVLKTTAEGASLAGSTMNQQERQQQLPRLTQQGNSNKNNDGLNDDEVQIVQDSICLPSVSTFPPFVVGLSAVVGRRTTLLTDDNADVDAVVFNEERYVFVVNASECSILNKSVARANENFILFICLSRV